MKTIQGYRYSTTPFEEYTHRAKVELYTPDLQFIYHSLDVYTDNPSIKKTADIIRKNAKDDVVSLDIVYWTTKEQDDRNTEFITQTLTDL